MPSYLSRTSWPATVVSRRTWSAVAASQEAQEEPERPAAGIAAHVLPRPALEVADIFRGHGPAWRQANAGHVSLGQLKVMAAIENCRTAALGGHVARCENENCAYTLIAYNSCLMSKFRNGELTVSLF